MESLMRFGRTGCAAVLQHYEAWKKAHAERFGKKRKEERWQIEYARAAERIWFQRHDALHLELQDIWESRIANKHPVRGCLRKVVSMVRMSPSGIRLRRKKEWFCEARRHAAKFMRSTALVHSADKREVGDRGELVLFSSPQDAHEIYQVLERYYEEASKLFNNNRTKDQAGILVAHIRQRGYYPIRTTQAFQWLSSRKKKSHKRKFPAMDSHKSKVRKQPRSRKRKRPGAASGRATQKQQKATKQATKQNLTQMLTNSTEKVTKQQNSTPTVKKQQKCTQTATKQENSTQIAIMQQNATEKPTEKPTKQQNSTQIVMKQQELPFTGRKKERSVLVIRPASQPTGQDRYPTSDRNIEEMTKPCYSTCKESPTEILKDENQEKFYKREKITTEAPPRKDERSPVDSAAATTSQADSPTNPQPSFVMSILNSNSILHSNSEEDKLVSEMIQSFELQQDWSTHNDFTQPLAEGLDLLLDSDLSQVSGFSSLDYTPPGMPCTPPAAERRNSGDSNDPSHDLLCAWSADLAAELTDSVESRTDTDRKIPVK